MINDSCQIKWGLCIKLILLSIRMDFYDLSQCNILISIFIAIKPLAIYRIGAAAFLICVLLGAASVAFFPTSIATSNFRTLDRLVPLRTTKFGQSCIIVYGTKKHEKLEWLLVAWIAYSDLCISLFYNLLCWKRHTASFWSKILKYSKGKLCRIIITMIS
jgi:hypothetical protein